MKQLRRLRFALLFCGASAGALAMLALACSSFSETSSPATPDADTNGADAGVDAPAAETGSNDAMPDRAAPPFCAPTQGGPDAHVFCADFEDGLTTTWRPNKDSLGWTVEHGEALTLVDGTVPGQPGEKFLQALTGAEPNTDVNVQSGGLVFTSPSMSGVVVAFDMRADQVSTPGGVTAFDVKLSAVTAPQETRIYVTLTATGGALVVAISGQPSESTPFNAGFPLIVGAWRHFVLEVGGTGRIVQLKEDGFTVVATKLPVITPLPASAKLRIGAPYFLNGPIRMFWDNVTLDALP